MSDYTPSEDEVAVVWLAQYDLGDAGAGKTLRREGEESWDRFIAKLKADALREWAHFQESALEASHHALDQDELNTTLAWIDDAKAYALRIEGEA